jgi:hypothetical protein
MKIKTKLSFLFITVALLAFAAFFVYQKIFHSNVEKDAIVYIKTGSEFEDVLKSSRALFEKQRFLFTTVQKNEIRPCQTRQIRNQIGDE